MFIKSFLFPSCWFKKEEDSTNVLNGHAVDVVEAANKKCYRAGNSRDVDKLDLSQVTNNEIADENGEGKGASTYRVSEGEKGTVPYVYTNSGIELPRWDARWPVDVWVSCGEPFVPLEGEIKSFNMYLRSQNVFLLFLICKFC